MDIKASMAEMGRAARDAARIVAAASVAQRNDALLQIRQALAADRENILAANAQDRSGRENGLDAALLDRLAVNAAAPRCAGRGLGAGRSAPGSHRPNQ